ncbi:asparaginase [Roseibium sp.]|uniref:asparaginase n=1 Tax=Roseibium sp. TaxID=1936156 RepID=UPI003B5247F0
MSTLLIHTGGTIGMDKTADGFAPREGVLEQVAADLSRQQVTADPSSIQNLSPLIDSASSTPRDWHRIAATIFENYPSYDGFIVTHGTDTLAYTSSALCLALSGLNKPVIVTGAMLPLTVEGTDGVANLKDALQAARTAAPGVWVQFAGHRLHGARVRKSHSRAFDAFEAEDWDTPPVIPAPQLSLNPVAGNKVGVVSVTPGIFTDPVAYAADRCDGLLLRCYGSGTAPDTPDMRAALTRAQDRQIPVIAVSQCPEGGMKLGTYAAGKVMRDTGVIDGRDMTPEMAYAKLQFCLTQAGDLEEKRQYLSTSLCGEFTV